MFVYGALMPALRSAATAAADLLLPRVCAVCARPSERDAMVCGLCWSRAVRLPEPQCRRCGHPLPLEPNGAGKEGGSGGSCRYCESLPPYVRAVRSFAWMDRGTGSAIVHALKYGGWWRTGEEIGMRLARLSWPADVIEERAMVVPVPLAPARERERGYNQSAAIARPVAAQWRVRLRTDVLARRRATRSQTRLTPGERLANVSGAFAVSPAARRAVRNAHVILVDDVITTGATLDACASALLEAGARITSYLTFGRAPALGDR